MGRCFNTPFENDHRNDSPKRIAGKKESAGELGSDKRHFVPSVSLLIGPKM